MTEVIGAPEPDTMPSWCTVVVPCYNEAKRLHTASFTEFLAQGHPVRFLFVNDGSRDETLQLLHSLRDAHPGVVDVLDKKPNGGKAEAVRAGMLHVIAQGGSAFTGFWDADLATPLSSIPELLREFSSRPQIQMVFGSRVRLLGRHIHRRATRHYLGRCFATTASLMLRMPIYDTQCGAKLFRVTPELASVLAAPFTSRWIFDVEMLARFVQLHGGHSARVSEGIYECPLQAWRDVAGSKVGSLDFLKAFGELLAIRQTYL